MVCLFIVLFLFASSHPHTCSQNVPSRATDIEQDRLGWQLRSLRRRTGALVCLNWEGCCLCSMQIDRSVQGTTFLFYRKRLITALHSVEMLTSFCTQISLNHDVSDHDFLSLPSSLLEMCLREILCGGFGALKWPFWSSQNPKTTSGWAALFLWESRCICPCCA